MGTYTENLNLYNTNMNTDGNDYFDFDRDLNQNNIKIDSAIGKLSNLTTTAKNNLVSAINEVYAISDPTTRLDYIRTAKGMLETNTQYNNATMMADVSSYFSSTFKQSNFTVVGNPTIMPNGIMLGNGSNTDYLTTPVIDFPTWYVVVNQCLV